MPFDITEAMIRNLLISLALSLALAFSCHAGDKDVPGFTFGAEWGYVAVFYSGYHYNFFAPEGFRVDPRGRGFRYASNAEAYIHAGCNIGSKWNISVYAGLSGVEKYHMTIPVSLRGTRYFGNSYNADRWFSFLDLGSGICIKKDPQAILTGKIGGGYRISLSKKVKLDFTAALRTCLTHPDIDYYGTIIPMDKVNRNNAYISAVSIGMALTF